MAPQLMAGALFSPPIAPASSSAMAPTARISSGNKNQKVGLQGHWAASFVHGGGTFLA